MKYGDMVNLNEISGREPWSVPALIINGTYAVAIRHENGQVPVLQETKAVDDLVGTRIHKEVPIGWLEKF